MSDLIDAEDLYYTMCRAAEDDGIVVDDDADDALARAAEAQASAHNARVCTECGKLREAELLAGKPCQVCRRTARRAAAAEELPEIEAQIAELEARREELLRLAED